jgi:hypothetical protein
MSIAAKAVNLSASSGVQRKAPGDRFRELVEITFDNSYPTGGYLIDSATLCALLGWSQIEEVSPHCLGSGLNGTVNNFSYDQANKKILLYNGSTQVTNATDVSAHKLYATVYGS